MTQIIPCKIPLAQHLSYLLKEQKKRGDLIVYSKKCISVSPLSILEQHNLIIVFLKIHSHRNHLFNFTNITKPHIMWPPYLGGFLASHTSLLDKISAPELQISIIASGSDKILPTLYQLPHVMNLLQVTIGLLSVFHIRHSNCVYLQSSIMSEDIPPSVFYKFPACMHNRPQFPHT